MSERLPKIESSNVEKEQRAERRENYLEHTTLIIPQNDGESIMIGEIADLFGIDTRRIEGDWDLPQEERDTQLKQLQKFKTHLVAVELASPEIEEEWEKSLDEDGSFTWIDHHNYPNLDRVRKEKNGKSVGCSLDQFLYFFGLDEKDLFDDANQAGFEYDWRFIRGVAINDDAFIGGMISEGYTIDEIKSIRKFDRDGQYGKDSTRIHKRNQEVFKSREVLEIPEINCKVSIFDFGRERLNYTYAKDLAMFEQLEEIEPNEDGEVVTQKPTLTVVIRPSIHENKFDLAVDMEGLEKDHPFREILFGRFEEGKIHGGLNSIQIDRRVSSVKPKPSSHWWKVDVDQSKVEEVKAFIYQLAKGE